MLATVPDPVVWDGMFHVKVHCAAASPGPCRGDVDVRVPQGDASAFYRVGRGKTRTVTADPGFSIGPKLAKVVVRIEPAGQPSVDVTRRLVHRAAAGNGGGSDVPFRHASTDRRGDGAGPLDLRTFSAYVRKGRLVLTWTTWRPFTPAQLDHDTGNMAAEVFKAKPQGKPGNYGAGVFYLRGSPVAKGGNSDFYDPGIRITRPSRRSIRIAVPMSRYGRRPRQLWIFPIARAGDAEDEGGPVHIKVPR
jgi:hypothetical protein